MTGRPSEKKYIIETTGSGVALIDYDNDGWLDIFLVNGTTLEGFPKGQEPINHLYRNNKNGTFTDVTEKANLARSGWGQGACVGDFDNDGFDDLFVTYWGQNALYRNNGKGAFTDVTEKAGLLHEPRDGALDVRFWTMTRTATWIYSSPITLISTSSKTPAKGSNQYCLWKGIPVMCGPRGLPAGQKYPLSEQRRRDLHRRLREERRRQANRTLRVHIARFGLRQ